MYYAKERFFRGGRAVWGPALAGLFVLIFVTLWLVNASQASADIVVNSTQDRISNDGACTLREAIIAANKDKHSSGKPGECAKGHGADTIVLPAGTFVLTRSDSGKEDSAATGDLDISSDVTIVGSPGATVVDGNEITDRVFHILEGNVSISGLTRSTLTSPLL